MRELARREPTFALHVHVGIADPETAIRVANRMRVHLPLLLALSANSPFWQGRDTGLASARTPLFQAFPRVGIPRAFDAYEEYVESVDMLIRCEAVPEPTFLWWDVRPQPRFGTVEVRIMDAQTSSAKRRRSPRSSSASSGSRSRRARPCERSMPQEVIAENRFLAARDGMDARADRSRARAAGAGARAARGPARASAARTPRSSGARPSSSRFALARKKAPRDSSTGRRSWDRCHGWWHRWRTTSSPATELPLGQRGAQGWVVRRKHELGDDQVRRHLRSPCSHPLDPHLDHHRAAAGVQRPRFGDDLVAGAERRRRR